MTEQDAQAEFIQAYIQTIRDLVRQARQTKGLSTLYVANLIGCSGATVSRFETGNRNLSFTFVTFISICIALQVCPDTLMAQARKVCQDTIKNANISWCDELPERKPQTDEPDRDEA